MEKDDHGQRWATWFLLKEGATPADVHRRLQSVCGDGAPSRRTVYNWAELFTGGRDSAEKGTSSGRPRTAVSEENVQRVEDMIADDRRITVRELADILGIGPASVHEILSTHLNVRKVVARWVPKLLTPDMKRTRVELSTQLLEMVNNTHPNFYDRLVTGDESWVLFYEPDSRRASMEWRRPGEAPPTKLRSEWSTKKRMALFFWDIEGLVLLKWVPEGGRANTQFYCEALRELRENIRENRRGKLTRGVLLQHDNASCHTSAVTTATLRELGFEVVPHPPYSPDLAPSDYWLFGPLKQYLRGRRYDTIHEVGQVVNRWLRERPDGWYADGLRRLTDRWQRCVQKRGDFVELGDEDQE